MTLEVACLDRFVPDKPRRAQYPVPSIIFNGFNHFPEFVTTAPGTIEAYGPLRRVSPGARRQGRIGGPSAYRHSASGRRLHWLRFARLSSTRIAMPALALGAASQPRLASFRTPCRWPQPLSLPGAREAPHWLRFAKPSSPRIAMPALALGAWDASAQWLRFAHPTHSYISGYASRISSASARACSIWISGPCPIPGQYCAVFCHSRRLSTSSGQKGKIRHCVGFAG